MGLSIGGQRAQEGHQRTGAACRAHALERAVRAGLAGRELKRLPAHGDLGCHLRGDSVSGPFGQQSERRPLLPSL